jgi:hypothetical protein
VRGNGKSGKSKYLKNEIKSTQGRKIPLEMAVILMGRLSTNVSDEKI